MRPILVLALIALLATPTLAHDLGHRGPAPAVKPPVATAPPAPDPEVLRQGGDTIADAVVIYDLWAEYLGTTVGYTDDYDEVCPYPNSDSPDVVYAHTATHDTSLDIDLFGSTYDTKLYVYDQDLELVACNDDFYSDYVSKLENILFEGGVTYYIVIDGYGGDAGDYVLNFWIFEGPWFECPGGDVQHEGEPPLEDGYVDEHNGGCNSPDAPGGPPFQRIVSDVFCGVTGWYDVAGEIYRDTDWLIVQLGPGGVLTVDAAAYWNTYLFELGPQDCDEVGVLQVVEFGNDVGGQMIVTGEPGSDVWLWVGPTDFSNAVPPWEYGLFLQGVVTVEASTWTSVKKLFE
jgi:hypothetical protein